MPRGLTLVAGATGALGLQVCEALRREGGQLRALVRPGADPGRLALLEALGAELLVGDLEQRQTLPAAVAGARFVITTASVFPRDPRPDGLERLDRAGSINLVDAAAAAGVSRFVYVSFRAIEPDFPFQQAKRAVEARLAGSGMDFAILRPGSFMDVWCSPMLGFDLRAGAVRVYGDGAARASWICAADVAEFALWALEAEAARNATLDLGGPEALSYDEIIELYEELSGRALRRTHVALAELEAQYAAAVGPVERSLAAITLAAARGGVTDMSEAVALSGISLTSLRTFATAQLASSAPPAER